MRSRSVLLAAGACLASLTLTVGSAAADPPTPTPTSTSTSTSTPEFGHPPCTATSSASTGPVRSVPTPQPLHPVGTSSPTTPVVSTPTPTDTIPTATTTAGCVTLFSTPHGNSAGPILHLGGDGNFWFPDGTNIVRMLSHAPYTQTDFPIPGGAPFGITTGPDGNIWFTELGQQFADPHGKPGQVGRILTHAPYTVTEFPVPGAVAKVYDIATGGDGNLWITRPGTGGGGAVGTPEIDRMLPHAPYTITQFPLPAINPPLPPSAGPELLVADRQGNLWFNFLCSVLDPACFPSPGLGEISPLGSHPITVFPVNAGPTDISIGPRHDPNSVWSIGSQNAGFTGPYHLIRMDTITHAVTTYPVTMTGVPNAIAAGPDGNMWITEARTGYVIGRFQTHAPFTFSEIPLPDDTYSISPTCGPDGNEWFATNRFPNPPDNPQGNPGLIGRVNLTGSGPPGLRGGAVSGLPGDLQSLLGGLRHDACPASTPGI
ncbi:MAG: hypothetical protein JO281_19265 [Pseudonocardiales bacterium]|nr:hypothetical protein [Pseudonocardiales bacterium]